LAYFKIARLALLRQFDSAWADCCVRSRFFFGLAQALLKPVLHTARNQLLPKKGFFFKKGLFLGGNAAAFFYASFAAYPKLSNTTNNLNRL